MKLFIIFSLAILAVYSATLNHCDSPTKIKGHYIVTYNDYVSREQADSHILGLGLNMKNRYTYVLNGFSAILSEEQVTSLLADEKVNAVECEQLVTIDAECLKQEPAGSWGKTRVSQENMDLDGKYFYPSEGPNDVDAYIIDTGIYLENNDFGGRAVFGFKATGSWSNGDGNGHGTHVASTVGGNAYGVAPYVKRLIAVKVLGDNGSGSTGGVIAGVDWTADQTSKSSTRSVVNLSLGGSFSSSLNAAINRLAKEAVTIVAAGNDNRDACDYSPASAADSVSVCSTEASGASNDVRSIFSNYGTCVDICAPGTSITAAWIGGKSATRTISGTSMAAPHVAGVAAILLSNDETNMSPEEVKETLIGTATPGKINMNCGSTGDCSKTPNLMLFNGC